MNFYLDKSQHWPWPILWLTKLQFEHGPIGEIFYSPSRSSVTPRTSSRVPTHVNERIHEYTREFWPKTKRVRTIDFTHVFLAPEGATRGARSKLEKLRFPRIDTEINNLVIFYFVLFSSMENHTRMRIDVEIRCRVPDRRNTISGLRTDKWFKCESPWATLREAASTTVQDATVACAHANRNATNNKF